MVASKKELADDKWQEFKIACQAAGYKDHFDAYKAEQSGKLWPFFLEEAHRVYIDAVHDYYLSRFGSDGVLGGKGL